MRTLLLVLLLAPASRALAAPTDELRVALKTHFLNHDAGAPIAETAVPFPGSAEAAIEELRLILQAASEIQLGCQRPCDQQADILLYRGKVEMVSDALGLESLKPNAIARYLPEGKPRLRPLGAPPSTRPGDKLIEARVAELYLKNSALSPQLRAGLADRAKGIADALGSLTLVDGPIGVAAGGRAGGPRTAMTPEQLAQLNAVPRVQAAILRDLAAKPPPPPPHLVSRDDRLISRAVDYIDSIGERPDINNAARFGVAMWRQVLAPFEGYERSLDTYFTNLSDPNTTTLQSFKDGAAVAGNGFLAAAGLLPAGAWTHLGRVTGVTTIGRTVTTSIAESQAGQRIAAVAERAKDKLAAMRPGALTAEEAARAATIRARAQAGQEVGEAEARWYSEKVAGQTEFVWHKTKPSDVGLIFTKDNAGRMQARTETYVYGTTKEVNSAWRRMLAGSRSGSTDGVNIVFQGPAAALFSRHMPQGFYTLWKTAANQRITNGAGDIIITAWKKDPESSAIIVTGARMATREEGRFAIELSTVLRHPEVKRATRFLALDVPATLAVGAEILVISTDGQIIEMVPGLALETAAR